MDKVIEIECRKNGKNSASRGFQSGVMTEFQTMLIIHCWLILFAFLGHF